jgi:hypothetical protein
MADSAAALADQRLRPPRQGDSDEGHALVIDALARGQWPSLLALADALVGRLGWWPRPGPDAASTIIGALVPGRRDVPGRSAERPYRFADAGITLLRADGNKLPEIWCRCDGGPHGFLGIAAHAHADALSVEVRYGGVDILADPGTYCYHGEPAWRAYFRSTLAHNTVEVGRRSSSAAGGPFLWSRHATARETEVVDEGDFASWTASHDGYAVLDPPARHQRSVLLDRASRIIDIVDEIDTGGHDIRLAFHLGPDVQAELSDTRALLGWPAAATPGMALLELSPVLRWTLHRGETDPILGWYSPGFGQRVPAWTLLGRGRSVPGVPLTTRLEFTDGGKSPQSAASWQAVSLYASNARPIEAPESQVEAR